MLKTPTKAVRVGVVDDQGLLVEGLKLLIDSMVGFECCWSCGDTASALERVMNDPPDILLVELKVGSRGGLELVKELCASGGSMPILVLSMENEAIYAKRALRAGAKGYLMKSASSGELRAALCKVLRGDVAVSAKVADQLLLAHTNHELVGEDPGVARLTDRELEIFQLIGSCRSGAQIAEELGISPKTVDVYKSKMRTKLGLEAGASLTAHAIRWVEIQKLQSRLAQEGVTQVLSLA